MDLLSLILLALSGSVAVLQTAMGLRLARTCRRSPPPPLSDAECPAVLAVLCLRGTDPFLRQALQQLFQQDYPDYRIRVVLDSATDPARTLLEDVQQEFAADNVEILTLRDRDRFCSAKMSSLLQATSDLPDETQFVVTIDGDCVLHPTCLRELVEPLVRSDAAVTTGNRWYAPDPASLGAMARLLWNMACVPFMQFAGLPWGGCLAMRRAVIEDAQIRTLYAAAFAEDMLLGSVMRQRGQSVCFVPQATIVNRESISLSGLFNFLTRQMLCVRLHHHRWPLIVGWACVASGLIGVVCPLGLLVPGVRTASALGLLLMLISSMLTMALTARCMRRLVGERGERLAPFTPRFVIMLILAVPVTQWMTVASSLRSIFVRRITWRGLTYQFAARPRVRLVHEQAVSACEIERDDSSRIRPLPTSLRCDDVSADRQLTLR